MVRKSVCLVVLLMVFCAGANAELVQHWQLDDAAGTFTDGLGYTVMPIDNVIAGGNEAMIVTPADQQSLALFGQGGASAATGASIIFNGRHDGIELGDIAPDPNATSNNPFTIAFWFKTSGLECFNDASDRLISANRGQAGRWEMSLQGDTVTQSDAGQTIDLSINLFHSGGASFTLEDAVDAGQWYHLALVRSSATSSNLRLYVNGVEEVVQTDTAGFTVKADADGAVRMGHKPANSGTGVSRGYSGGFDDIRVYDEAVSADEVWALSHPETYAYNPVPANGAQGVSKNVTLEWDTALDGGVVNPNVTAHYLYVSSDPMFTGVSPITISAGIPPAVSASQAMALDADTTYYWRVDESISNSGPTDAATLVGFVWSLVTAKDVTITSQPEDALASLNGSASFTVTAESDLAITYTWYYSPDNSNATPGDDDVAGGGATLNLSGIDALDEGFYYCIASNGQALDYSETAQLGVKRLLAYWSLDDDAAGWDGSNYLDESSEDPVSQDATPVGTPTFVAGQKAEGVGITSGWGHAGTWNPSEFTGRLTVSIWLNWGGANGTWQHFITKRTGSWAAATGMWQVASDNNGDDLWFAAPGGRVSAEDVLIVGEWMHIVATYDGQTGKLYVNGEYVNENDFEFGEATDGMITLGDVAEGILPGTGSLDEIRIYNYDISELDVAVLYTTDAPGETACVRSLQSPYDFDDNCIVDLADFAKISGAWLDCAQVPNCLP